MGYSKRKTLFTVLSWCMVFCIFGIIVSRVSNSLGIAMIAIVAVLCLILGIKMSRVVING